MEADNIAKMDNAEEAIEAGNSKRIKKTKKWQRFELFFIGSFVVWISLTIMLKAFCDDFTYFTSPNPDFDFQSLKPGHFWRPIDALFGGGVGFLPNLFPYINHVFIVAGHIFGAYFLYKTLLKLNIFKKTQ